MFALYRWGVAMPQGLLTSALVMVMASALLSTRAFLLLVFNSTAILITLGYLQHTGTIQPDFSWQEDNPQVKDTLIFAGILLAMVLVSWLSRREIERSLKRTRRFLATLRVERDNLESRVEHRIQDLKQAQAEKTRQLYRFVDFGRKVSSWSA